MSLGISPQRARGARQERGLMGSHGQGNPNSRAPSPAASWPEGCQVSPKSQQGPGTSGSVPSLGAHGLQGVGRGEVWTCSIAADGLIFLSPILPPR